MKLTAFAATHEETVRQAVVVAEVDSASVVYDLGCGDGRISVECAKIPAAKIVGVDLNEVYLKMAWNNYKTEIINPANINFIHDDIDNIDISDATHIFYTCKHSNEKKLIQSMSEKAKLITFGWSMVEPLKLIKEHKVNAQGLVYQLAISIRNFENVQKLYPLTVKELIEEMPVSLQPFWAGPFWNNVMVWQK